MKKISRRRMLETMGRGVGGALLCETLAAGRAAATPKQDARPPNIVFILADDLGYGDLGCYGQEQFQTPNLDRMAAQGVRFTQCYAGSTVCAPSRCSLMTGLHTGHAYIRGNALVALRPQDATVAETLKSAGYATALIGKWGLGEPGTTGVPNRKGFDEFFGYLNQGHAHNSYPTYLWRNEGKESIEGNVEDPDHPGVCATCTTYSNDLFTREALRFIERKKDVPFFLYLAYTIPHANNERQRVRGDGMEVPDYGAYADKTWPQPQKGFAAAITRMDRDLGSLFGALRTLGLDENTIVFFTSDNGPHKEGGADPRFFRSAGPLRGHKRDLYEGGIRVPMIVRWPGKCPAGSIRDQVWAFWDFLPTAADLAHTHAPDGLDGVSMAPALFGKPQQGHDFLYWEFHERGFTRAVRTGDWKGVRLGSDKPIELYDLAHDIGETRNVAGEHPDVIARIEAYLRNARTPSEHWLGK